MSPKEKARELFDKFTPYAKSCLGWTGENPEYAKQCAIICVYELINATFVSSKDTVPYDERDKQFWQEVKKEIEKL